MSFLQICRMRVADGETKCSDELLSLANGPLGTSKSYTACNVNGVRFVVRSRDDRRTTQNSGVTTPGEDDSIYYGQLEDILEVHYGCGFNVVLFRCRWFKTNNTKGIIRCIKQNNITSISTQHEWYKEDQYILPVQAKQVFYLDDLSRNQHWKVVQEVNHRKLWDKDIIEENEVDLIHGVNSSDLSLDADLDRLTYTRLSVPGQSTSIEDFTPTTLDHIDPICDEDPEIPGHLIDVDSDEEDVEADLHDVQLTSNDAFSSDDDNY